MRHLAAENFYATAQFADAAVALKLNVVSKLRKDANLRYLYINSLLAPMDLAGIDLNLLVVFDALMAERHVTRAGERIGLSQPAVSAALNRLRHLLKDDLFIRRSDGMQPTRRAQELAVPLRQALAQIQAALEPQTFDLTTAQRVFKLATNDFAASILLPGLGTRLSREAPGLDLRSFVDHKGNKQWVWLALDVATREIVGCWVGDRSGKSAVALWRSLPAVYRQCTVIYTDDWEAYATTLPSSRHCVVSKQSGLTSDIERFNNTLRQRVSH